jgi:hypothetical protein
MELNVRNVKIQLYNFLVVILVLLDILQLLTNRQTCPYTRNVEQNALNVLQVLIIVLYVKKVLTDYKLLHVTVKQDSMINKVH